MYTATNKTISQTFVGRVLFVLSVLSFVLSCKTNSSSVKHQSIGAPGELLLVMDADLMNTSVKNIIIDFAEQEFPSIPQPEATFKLTKINTNAFERHFKTYRNILMVRIDSSLTSPLLDYRKDIWAENQRIVSIKVSTKEQFEKLFSENSNYIHSFLYYGDIESMALANKKDADAATQQYIFDKYGIKMVMPKGYRLVKDTANFTWFRFDERENLESVVIHTFSLDSLNNIDVDALVSLSDYVGKNFIPGPTAKTYMTTEKRLPVIFNQLKKQDRDILEIRGLWKVEGFFMGGPFVNHFIVDKAKNQLIMIEAFVHAPKKQNKAYYVRRLESILYSLQLI